VRVLERVERSGAFADLALHAALHRSGLRAPDRGFVTDLVYGTLRWRGRLDYLLGFVLDRDWGSLEPRVATLLRVGAYQIALAERVPVSAAVDQSVRCAHALGIERAAGLVNAALRRLAREIGSIPFPPLSTDPVGHLTHALSLPAWIAERWVRQLGAEEAAALAAASNRAAPLTVRVNPQRAEPQRLLEELHSRFPEARPCPYAPLGLRLGPHGRPGEDPAFLDGRFTVQDEASQLVVELLEPRPGEHILDLCAAPGTKTTALAERVGPGGCVVAVDRNRRRLALVGRACQRLGLENVRLQLLDATRPLPALPGAPFDRILVDAPCSGLGTLRRNPDARWRIRPEDPARLAEIQRALLRRALDCLRPGGTLVYSTCTLLSEENEAVVGALRTALQAEGSRPLLPAPRPPWLDRLQEGAEGTTRGEDFLRTWPHRHDMDGFFAARLVLSP